MKREGIKKEISKKIASHDQMGELPSFFDGVLIRCCAGQGVFSGGGSASAKALDGVGLDT